MEDHGRAEVEHIVEGMSPEEEEAQRQLFAIEQYNRETQRLARKLERDKAAAAKHKRNDWSPHG